MKPDIRSPVCLSEQVNEAAEIIYDLVDANANLIFGAVVDPALGQEVSESACLLKSLVLGTSKQLRFVEVPKSLVRITRSSHAF